MPLRPTGKRRPVRDTPGAPGKGVDQASPAGAEDSDELPVGDEALREELTSGAPAEPADASDAQAADDDDAELAAAELAAATLEAQAGDEAPRPAGRRESWRRRSATGAILTGFAFGLQQVFEPEKKEPAIVMETSGDPPRDLPVEAELEMATTRRSVVRIRPWLLDEAAEEDATGAAPTTDAEWAPSDEEGRA